MADEAHGSLTVNDVQVDVDLTDAMPLIHVLRSDLGLLGVRAGCSIGECGACTVLVDGEPVRSCITPASEVVGKRVVTPEGLGTPASPHPIQQVFIDRQAAQCGYCVNGMIMRVAALAGCDDDVDVRAALDDHLCRCGTHVRLLAAAEEALGRGPSGRAAPTAAEAPTTPVEDDVPLPSSAVDTSKGVTDHPRVEQWIEVGADGRFTVHAGKVEIGQGIRSAFCRIVAAHLGVAAEQIRVAPTRTGSSPDQWFTAGSLSIEEGGTSLARAAAACRRVLLERAAEQLGVAASTLTLDADGVHGAGHLTFAELVTEGPVTGPIEPTDVPDWTALPAGETGGRADLPIKLTGAPAYLQDLQLPDMLHARVVLPPTPRSQLTVADVTAARSLAGVVDVVVDGRLLIVVAEREHQAVRAAERLRRDLVWDVVPVEAPADVAGHLRSLPQMTFRVRNDEGIEHALEAGDRHGATYTTPYQSHGSMAPSAAAAVRGPDGLHVWTHAQGVYPLRRELAATLGVAEDEVTVEHVDGPGCYGMNGGDDAAGLAAVAASALPGRPIKLQLSIADEFGWEPYGPAMVMDLDAALDDAGRIQAWRHHTITDVHMARPSGAGDRLIASWLRRDGRDQPWSGPSEGGARNAAPLYDVPQADVVAHHVQGPLRTGPLRCLGAYANIFASESFVDELAERAGRDPVEFRLAHLTDARARHVLEVAAERAGWRHHVGPSGRGMGVAVAHYKDSKAYVAQVAEVDVDPEGGEFRVARITVVADAGVVVSPDGIRNQLEGGTLQGLSRALYEELTPGPHGAQQTDWTSYRVLRFRDVPEIDVHLVHRPDFPPLGAGESATPPVPAAIANAIDDAIGIRLRRLPLTPAQMQQRLLEMDERESARVRL